MGQKVNAHGLRIGINKGWDSAWYSSKKQYADWVIQDKRIRDLLFKIVGKKYISRVIIERVDTSIKIIIMTSSPGVVIKKESKGLIQIKKALKEQLKLKHFNVEVRELENAYLDAQTVAWIIAEQIENRISHRIAQKKAIANVMGAGAQGIKIKVSGRLGGVDMARQEGYTKGKVPMQTLKSKIAYGFAEAKTKYGQIGVKVWIYTGIDLGKRGGNFNVNA